METSLLDTNIFSEILRGRNDAVTRRADAYRSVFGHFTIAVITVVEIVDGLRRRALQGRIDGFFRELTTGGHQVVPVDIDVARIAGFILGDLHRHGQPIGESDPLIAATALHLQIPLVTGNTRHFQRIQHAGYPLRLVEWAA